MSGALRAPCLGPEEQAPFAAIDANLQTPGNLLCDSAEGVPGQEHDSLSKYVLS